MINERAAVESLPIFLPHKVERNLIVYRGGLGLKSFEFGEDLNADDPLATIRSQQCSSFIAGRILGIHEESKRRLSVDGTEYVEANPLIRNIWVGENSRLYTPEEAATIQHGETNALRWALEHESALTQIVLTGTCLYPEMVVRASNGRFYTATKNDTVFPYSD